MTRAWSAALVLSAVSGIGGCNAVFGIDELVPGDAATSSVASSGIGGSAMASASQAQSSAASGVGGGAGGGGGGAGGVSTVGCADETRELFDPSQDPNIAGCSGAWSVAGLHTPASLVPNCNRQAGNDGSIPSGLGCSVEDLCSEGWHVCASAAEVAARSTSGLCSNSTIPGLWVARQGQADVTQQCTATGINNVVGCGNLGDPAHDTCTPLERRFDFETCGMTAAWECGPITTEEGNFVTKTDSAEGGVLCCRD